jgi:hypothetical protein
MRLALTEQLFAGLAGPTSVKKPPKSRTLILAPLSDTDSAIYAVLDEALCALELQLELEVDAATYAFILPFFPRLEASGAVCIFSCRSIPQSPWVTDMFGYVGQPDGGRGVLVVCRQGESGD